MLRGDAARPSRWSDPVLGSPCTSVTSRCATPTGGWWRRRATRPGSSSPLLHEAPAGGGVAARDRRPPWTAGACGDVRLAQGRGGALAAVRRLAPGRARHPMRCRPRRVPERSRRARALARARPDLPQLLRASTRACSWPRRRDGIRAPTGAEPPAPAPRARGGQAARGTRPARRRGRLRRPGPRDDPAGMATLFARLARPERLGDLSASVGSGDGGDARAPLPGGRERAARHRHDGRERRRRGQGGSRVAHWPPSCRRGSGWR